MPKEKSSGGNVKKRNWCFLVYPDSAPDNWRELLQKTGLQFTVSPLHDKDVNPDLTLKKSHYHVIVVYSGPTSFNVVRSLTSRLNAPIPQPLEQIRGYYRYFSHKDNPEKAQYDEHDITTGNGFSISDFVELSKGEITHYKKSLQKLIRDADILEYSDFMDLLQDSDMDNEYEIASNNTYFFEKYISSRRNKLKLKNSD